MADRDAVDRLRRIGEARLADVAVAPEDQAWLSDVVAAWLSAGPGRRLEEVAGVAARPGERSAPTRIAIERRDAALRAIAREHLPRRSVAEQAAEIARMARRYGKSWHRDRHLGRPPEAYRGTPKALLFIAFNSLRVPLSERHIRRILSA